MQSIRVTNEKFHAAIHAFKLLFDVEPMIYTCDRFVDETGSSVYGQCEVVSVGKTKVYFKADGEVYKAYIKDIATFVFI
jgi:hypothetical protein